MRGIYPSTSKLSIYVTKIGVIYIYCTYRGARESVLLDLIGFKGFCVESNYYCTLNPSCQYTLYRAILQNKQFQILHMHITYLSIAYKK